MDTSSLSSHSSQHCNVTSVSTSKDEYGIRQTTYKITIKIEHDLEILSFSSVYTSCPKYPTPIYSTGRSPNVTVNKGSKSSGINELHCPFSFHFEIDRNSQDQQRLETTTMFLKRASSFKEKAALIKYAVNINCGCKTKMASDNKQTTQPGNEDMYPDCNQSEMIDFMYRSHLPIDKHTHDCHTFGLRQIYYLSITELDFSSVTVFPYEAQELLSKRTLEKEVRETDGKYFEALVQPFDTTIICKDGYEIDVHAFILSTRSPIFKKILASSNFKISGRGSSFRKLARDTFTAKPDRCKKSKTVTIDESEVDSSAMKAVLHFIYFGELHCYWKSDLAGVLFAANKYGVKQLLDLISSSMITLCMKTNALGLLTLAQQYSLTGAESTLRDYIYTNLGGVLQASVKITSV